MLFELKGKLANVDNFAKKVELVVKEEADVCIPQRTTSLLFMDIDDSVEHDITSKNHPTLKDTA